MSLNRKQAVVGVTLLALALSVGIGARLLQFETDPPQEALPIQVKPFVIEQEHISYAAGTGPARTTERRIKMRRSDGSMAIIGTFPSRPQLGVLRKVDWMDGRSVTLVEAIKARISGRRSSKERAMRRARLLHPPAGCAYAGEVSEGEDVLWGQTARRVVQKTEGGKRIEWRLTGYECEAVQMEEWRLVGGVMVRTFEARLIQFSGTEPDEAVFNDWSSYRDLDPEEARKRILTKSGVTKVECPQCQVNEKAIGEAYRRFHDRKYD